MKTASETSDIWGTATDEEDDAPVIYRYRQNRPTGVDTSKQGQALRIVWMYDASLRNGMPPVDVNEQQIAFEDAIQQLGEAPHGHLMLVFTGNGRKEWLFYVRNTDDWMESFNGALQGHEAYPLQIEDWSDEAWSTWHDFASAVVGRS